MSTLNRLMVSMAFGTLLVTMTGLTTPVPVYADFDTTYEVTCYIGNPGSNRNVGNITISDISSAGALCNGTFVVCEGKCVGCVNDFDLDGTVCYDNSGKKFLR